MAVGGFVEGHVLPYVDRVVLLAPVVRVDTIKSAMGIAAGLFLVDQVDRSLNSMISVLVHVLGLR